MWNLCIFLPVKLLNLGLWETVLHTVPQFLRFLLAIAIFLPKFQYTNTAKYSYLQFSHLAKFPLGESNFKCIKKCRKANLQSICVYYGPINNKIKI